MNAYRQAVLRALDLIEAQLHAPIPLHQIARRAGFSLWHFHRIFAEQTGESLGSYIRRRRLTAAAADLAATHRPVLDIALEYQFESHEAFTRAFKAALGTTPSAYRRHGHLAWRKTQPRLTSERLHSLPRQITMKPQIIELPELNLLGLEARFIGPSSPDANNLAVIPPLYGKFNARRRSLPAPIDGYTYGACRCPADATRRHPDELEYLVSVNVAPGTRAPVGTALWKIPAGTYALFTHRGPIAKLGETINYVFGTWLPRSKFVHADGPNFDRSDERFGDGGEDCEFDYLIPVRAK